MLGQTSSPSLIDGFFLPGVDLPSWRKKEKTMGICSTLNVIIIIKSQWVTGQPDRIGIFQTLPKYHHTLEGNIHKANSSLKYHVNTLNIFWITGPGYVFIWSIPRIQVCWKKNITLEVTQLLNFGGATRSEFQKNCHSNILFIFSKIQITVTTVTKNLDGYNRVGERFRRISS